MPRVKKTTPVGTASYPWLNVPDTKFGAPGDYKVDLVLDPGSDPEVDAFLAFYEKFLVKAKADIIEEVREKLSEIPDNPKNKKSRAEFQNLIDNIDEECGNPLKDQYDDAGELTGKKILSCKSKAEFTDRKTNQTISLKPSAYDASGKYIEDPPLIKGGSTLKLIVNLSHYFMASNKTCGISKPKISSYQILKLSSGGGGDSFSAVEGGYVQEEKVVPTLDDFDEESSEY